MSNVEESVEAKKYYFALAMKTRSSSRKGSQPNNRPRTSPPLRSPPTSARRATSPSAPEDQSVASPSVTTVSSSRSRAGLSLHVQTQLAKDIEASGGIKVFIGTEHKLCDLLSTREEIYGRRADKIRTAISKKVYRWQLLDRKGQYVENVLNRFKISSSAVQKAEERDQLRKSIKKTPTNIKKNQCADSSLSCSSSESSSDSSSSSSSISHKVAASAPRLAPVAEFPPRFIEARPKSKTAAIEAKKRAPKPKKLSIESFPPVEANTSRSKSPRSPIIPLPRDTGK
jgi:hypothetical protein